MATHSSILAGRSPRTEESDGLQSLGLQRVGHDLATKPAPPYYTPFFMHMLFYRITNLPAMQETWVQSWVGKILWRREWQPTPVFLPGEPHGQRSVAGYSPWGHKESDTTERLTHMRSLRQQFV